PVAAPVAAAAKRALAGAGLDRGPDLLDRRALSMEARTVRRAAAIRFGEDDSAGAGAADYGRSWIRRAGR
ncbi:MAG: hypothetical protein WBX18_21205, partial [Terracidiphilus sp.]